MRGWCEWGGGGAGGSGAHATLKAREPMPTQGCRSTSRWYMRGGVRGGGGASREREGGGGNEQSAHENDEGCCKLHDLYLGEGMKLQTQMRRGMRTRVRGGGSTCVMSILRGLGAGLYTVKA